MAKAKKQRYGIINFLFDIMLVIFTGGFWAIWVFVREIRR